MTNEYRNTLLISARELKNANTLISTNVDDNYLGSTIITCQEVYLEEITGTALYRRLQELVYNQIIGADDKLNDDSNKEYKLLLEDLVKPYLKSRCVVDVLYPITYKIRNAGVVKSSDTNIQPADLGDIKYLEKQYLTYTAEYEQRLSKYLKDNKDSFKELSADIPSYFDEPKLGKEYANETGLYLGPKKKKSCNCI